MLTKEQYIEYLISTPVNYTCTNLAEHLSGISHDSMTDFLASQRLTAESVWSCAKTFIRDTENSFLIVDNSVQEKPYARAIELVYPHYSGNKHAVILASILLTWYIAQKMATIIRSTIAFMHLSTNERQRTITSRQC